MSASKSAGWLTLGTVIVGTLGLGAWFASKSERFGAFAGASLWDLPEGAEVEVPISRYKNDPSFIDMVEQLQTTYDPASKRMRHPAQFATHLKVRARTYDDFVKWVSDFHKDDVFEWDRYEGTAARYLRDKGLISESEYKTWGTTAKGDVLAKAAQKLGYQDEYALGLHLYVGNLADAIARGEDIPPLLTVDGKPADGRHRTFAARKLDRKVAPVADISAVKL
jgi:hypothetical protein